MRLSIPKTEIALDYAKRLCLVLGQQDFEPLIRIAESLKAVQERGGTVFTAGNGGSAANASHLALHILDVGIRAICLTDNIPLLTARANDYDYAECLWRSAKITSQDICVVISCSGKSPNIRQLAHYARGCGVQIIGLFGFGAKAPEWFDALEGTAICINSPDYGICEDVHSAIIHILHRLLTR